MKFHSNIPNNLLNLFLRLISLSSSLCLVKSVFDNVVAGAFQIAFRVEIHANNIFLFFKNYFWHQHIKTIQKIQTALNFSKKKNSKFDETQLQTQCRTVSKSKTKSWLGSRSKHQLLLVLASLTRISLQDKLIKATRITARKRTLQEKLEAISWIMLSKYWKGWLAWIGI
jgi:hypothetical protein